MPLPFSKRKKRVDLTERFILRGARRKWRDTPTRSLEEEHQQRTAVLEAELLRRAAEVNERAPFRKMSDFEQEGISSFVSKASYWSIPTAIRRKLKASEAEELKHSFFMLTRFATTIESDAEKKRVMKPLFAAVHRILDPIDRFVASEAIVNFSSLVHQIKNHYGLQID